MPIYEAIGRLKRLLKVGVRALSPWNESPRLRAGLNRAKSNEITGLKELTTTPWDGCFSANNSAGELSLS